MKRLALVVALVLASGLAFADSWPLDGDEEYTLYQGKARAFDVWDLPVGESLVTSAPDTVDIGNAGRFEVLANGDAVKFTVERVSTQVGRVWQILLIFSDLGDATEVLVNWWPQPSRGAN